jgi:hypothetical protein
MARRRRTRRELDDDEDAVDGDDVVPTPRRRRRPSWRRRFLLFVVLVVGSAIALPTIIAKTPLRNVLLSSAFPASAGQLAATDGAFSWIGGQSLAGVTLVDPQGKPLAQIESATIDRSLVALAANGRHLGKIVVTRPVIYFETRAGGSNLEDVVARLAEAVAKSSPESPGGRSASRSLAEIEILEATILGRDATTGQQWRIDKLSATARPAADGAAWEAAGTGFLSLADATAADASWAASTPAADAGLFKFQLHAVDGGAQQLDLLADRLPLAPLEPWLARLLPGARILGTTSAYLKLTWAPPMKATDSAGGFPSDLRPPASSLQPFSFSASGKLDAADLRFTSSALSNDLVELRNAAIAVDATLSGSRVTSRQCTVRSDWLQAEATGDFDIDQLTSLSPDHLPATDGSVTARVDLPQLTRMLPRTLRLRPGVRIDSGNFEITARSEHEDAGRHWTLAAAVENLVGSDGKRPIRWTQPVEAGLDLAEASAGPELKRILLRSPFASISADGAASGLEGQLEFNLDELAAQLGQFVDLSAWQLRGTGKGNFSWRGTGADKFAASAGLDCQNIDVRREGKIVWVDSDLHMELQSSGMRLGPRPIRIDKATAAMRGPHDALEAELLEPVDLAVPQHQWFVRVKGDGPLDSWAGRLRPWVAAVPDDLAGQSTVSARLRLSENLIEITQSQLSIRDFRTRVAGAELSEPRIEANGDFRWDATTASIDSQEAVFTSSTVAAKARGLALRFAGGGPPTVRGDVAFRGDLERIAAWAGLVGVDEGLWPRGQGVGRIQLASDADRASANLTLTAEPFTLVRATAGAPPAPAWQEPSLQLATELAYTSADDRLQLTNLRLDGQTVKLTGGGAIEQLRTIGNVRGDATLTYDSAELAKLLAAYLGPGVRIQGAAPLHIVAAGRLRNENAAAPSPLREDRTRGTQAHAVSTASPSDLEPAPHWSRRWLITTEAGFAAANLYGLPVGQAQLTANIRDGQVQIAPLDLAVGQGRLTAQPRALLDPPPNQFQLAAGPLVSNVAISAEVSDAMLKYAAPILANATRISGTFSIITEGVAVPLGDPKKATAKGRVTMHELSILPGPGLADVVAIIQKLEQVSRTAGKPENLLGAIAGQPAAPVKGITMHERTIDVQVVDGRVYHRNLEFLIDDVPVRSYGSVGFDQTMAIVLQIPVQEKWVRGTPALHGLIGQVIEIPVTGTFTQWKVDERAVGNFVAQAAQSAVGGALGGELNKALEGLFRRK